MSYSKSLRTIKIILPLLIIAVITFSFYTEPPNAQASTIYATGWFKFVGSDPTNLTQLQDNTEYEYVDGTACTGTDQICAVQTLGTLSPGQHPAPFSVDLKTRIAEVLSNPMASYADISEED